MISKIIGNQERPVSNSGDSLGPSVTLNGNPLSFSKDTAGLASNTVIALEPIQAGTGDPSPSNVRAISGYNSVEIVACGKNLFNRNDDSEVINANITNIVEINSNTKAILVSCARNTTYTVSKMITSRFIVGYIDTEPAQGVPVYESHADYSATSLTITTGVNAKYLIAYIWHGTYDTATIEEVLATVQIELGSTATAYEPYNPLTDLSIAMPGTVYGGTLDFESGELVVDKVLITPSSVSSTGSVGSTYYWTVAANLGGVPNGYVISSHFKSSPDFVAGNCYIVSTGQSLIAVPIDQTLNTKPLADAWMAANRPQFVYTLATPITYHLTPHQVALLQGANVVTTNGTSISLTHRQGEIAAQSDLAGIADSANNLAGIVSDVINEQTETVTNRGLTAIFSRVGKVAHVVITTGSTTSIIPENGTVVACPQGFYPKDAGQGKFTYGANNRYAMSTNANAIVALDSSIESGASLRLDYMYIIK